MSVWFQRARIELTVQHKRHSCTQDAFTEESAQALTEEEQMREYRAQLDADRAKKLSKGTNHADLREAVGDKSKVIVV